MYAAAAVATVLALIWAVFIYFVPRSDTPGSATPHVSRPPLPSVDPSTTSDPLARTEERTPGGISSSPSPEADSPTSDSWYYLADLEPVETEIEGRAGGCTGGCAGFDGGSASTAGDSYTRSYIMRLDADGDRSTSTWNALRSCSRFEATVGLDDESDSAIASFTIELDGEGPRTLAELRTGESKHVTIEMGDIYRFVLAASLMAEPENDGQSAVWGDARLLCDRPLD